ncbi:MAG: right-handed parallel beta-helix repeat-containing protein [Sedimentisphaerales bacterium]
MQKEVRKKYCIVLLIFLAVYPAYCSTYFVAPNGNDSSSGTINHPFKTIPKAVSLAKAGDTIFLRGGQHDYNATVLISKSGSPKKLITLQGYRNETAILDFARQQEEKGNNGIYLEGSYWHLKSIIIQHAGSYGFCTIGTHNIFEQIVTRMNRNAGFRMSAGAAYNLILNCDSYLNYDPKKHGEDADGFATKGSTGCTACLGPGNIIRGCRSWSNSDDGFDLWWAGNCIRVEDCWAFRNGENIWNDPNFQGDGNGFKLGQGGGAHIVIRCMAYNQQHNGFDLNRKKTDATGVTVYNCTGVRNGEKNFKFDNPTTGVIHVLRNNISYFGSDTIGTLIDNSYNSWNSGFSVRDADFASLDPNGIDGPRGSKGELPKLKFLRPAKTSSLIDAGIDVRLPFNGAGPDLGAFER